MYSDKIFQGIDHVELVVTPDGFDRQIDFFSEILGFEIKSRQRKTPPDSPLKEIVYMESEGSVIELMSVEDSEEMTRGFQVGYRSIAIEVDDMDETKDYLEKKGIEVTWGPKDLGESVRAEIKTPAGLPIELREWK